MAGELDGILVVALEQAVAAPFCTARMADAGARVIKVERPGGGDYTRGLDRDVLGQSAYFVWLNRGKESIAADLTDPEDAALVARMVARADVVVQNLLPGALKRLGLDSATLRARHPALITCDITGFGADGPAAGRKAYDLVIQAEAGLAAITGTPDGPGRMGVSAVDIGCGLSAYTAILEALVARGRTGQGRAIALSLFSAMAEWMTVPYFQHAYGGKAPKRVGLNHPSIAPYGLYPTADGELLLAVQNEREWYRLCEIALGNPAVASDPRFADNPSRVANRPALNAEIARVLGVLTRQQAGRLLDAAGIAWGALNDVAGFAAHPQLHLLDFGTPAGPVRMPAPAATLDGAPAKFGPVPALDQHGPALRTEFAARSGG
ncbi:MAG: CoA transferase [Alphaproteobacteria bacterium]|nr:CoA transferase [Alphaproteobacteria bacterium]